MKKILLFNLLLIVFTSCKKNYNCLCNTDVVFGNGNGQAFYGSNNKPITAKMNKKQAQAVCDQEAENITATYKDFWANNSATAGDKTTFSTMCSVQ